MYNFFPEMNHYFKEYWKDYGEITVDCVSLPEIDNYNAPTGSVFQLLFDNNYAENTGYFLFSIIPKTSLRKSLRERLDYIGSSIICYEASEETNVFEFTSQDIELFDLLLTYRLYETPDLSSIDYNILETRLSRMLFAYLDLMVNQNYEYINSESLMSDNMNMLETLFEIYLINEAYRTIKDWNFIVDSGLINVRPARQRFIIDSILASGEEIELDYVPYPETDIFVTRNGTLLNEEEYTIITASGTTISIPGLLENDIVLVSYYIEVA